MKEVATTTKTELAGFDDSAFSNVMPDQELSSRDIVIPKILTMQAGSPRVLEGSNTFGEMVDTLNWEVMARTKSAKEEALSLTCIPFFWKKAWIIRRLDNGRWVFDHILEMDRHNESLNPYEPWTDNGEDYKREYAHFFNVVIPGKPLPYTLCFRGASKKTGDALVTQMYVSNKMLKVKEAYLRSPMGAAIEVTPVKETNKDGNTYIKLEIRRLRESTKEEAVEALTWLETISSGGARTDYNMDEEQAGKKQEHVPDDIQF